VNAKIERIVAEHRAATRRRLGDLEEARRPRQLSAADMPRHPEPPPAQESDEPYYRPRSWLI
jgi:hypothetical protein